METHTVDDTVCERDIREDVSHTAATAPRISKKRKPGWNRCEVAECPNTSRSPGIKMFLFPSVLEVQRRRIWIHLCRRSNWKPRNGARMCSAHFLPSDIIRGAKRTRLSKDSIPSVFDCLPKLVRPASSAAKRSRKRIRKSDVLQQQPTTDPETELETFQCDALTAKRNHHKAEKEGKMLLKKLISAEKRLLAESTCLENANAEIRRLNAELQQYQTLDLARQSAIQELEERCHALQTSNSVLMENCSSLEATMETNKQAAENLAKQYEKNIADLQESYKKQEFRVEKFQGNDSAIQRLTGLPSYKHVELLFYEYFDGKNPEFVERFQLRVKGEHYPDRRRKRGGRTMSLSYFNQCFLALLKLRTGLTEDIISAIFCISQQVVSQYYNVWIKIMHERFQMLFCKWPEFKVPVVIPSHIARQFPSLTGIVDCFEIRIQKPKNPDTQRRCYSNYKRSTTVKVFVAMEPNGNICYVSHIYQGSISDVEIDKRSRFLDCLPLGSVILADRGFQLKELAASKGITWIVPPSVEGNCGMTYAELELTYKIARVRIHIERAIGRMKRWRELDGPLEITTLERKDKEIQVVAHLCKFLPDLIPEIEASVPSDDSMEPQDNVCSAFSVQDIFQNEIDC
ncbi:uncharacterized protein LOC129583099 [Paramacrobiotus metropolitanus]|uniref:uncharacterized protein LOC129583099 n=1 Tax=Paramacrobiotus metropolitanus TaxID=2943436 RepID=UPI0024456A09|nr:uncharacterized protein LOC129583099 [Paramacrobiotus metropolitanus]